MVFVTPKKDMIVKQSRNVDPNGKCYHPNLANWSSDPNVRNPYFPLHYEDDLLILVERALQNKQPLGDNSIIPEIV